MFLTSILLPFLFITGGLKRLSDLALGVGQAQSQDLILCLHQNINLESESSSIW